MEETKEKKNNVEEYVYGMRNKLCDGLKEFVSEEENAAFSAALEKTEDWLYDEGEDETKGVYSAKLDELMAVGNPIIQRCEEAGTRDDAAATLDTVAGVFLAQCAHPKSDHIDEAEREKVRFARFHPPRATRSHSDPTRIRLFLSRVVKAVNQVFLSPVHSRGGATASGRQLPTDRGSSMRHVR
jgi:hypothetical protein